jgi:hypothetical protein
VILKDADDKSESLSALESLLPYANPQQKRLILEELRIHRAGIRGEKEVAYLIDFDFKDSRRTAVIHDLRLEIGSRIAQIDHLLIHRTLNVFVLESKHLHSGLKISDTGEFLRWNDFKKNYDGMPSPIAQNERHITVLKEAFDQINMPVRLGVKLEPVFHSYVLVSPSARIDRSQRFDSSRIIKADVLLDTIDKHLDKQSVLSTLSSMVRFVSEDVLEDIGRQLIALHKGADYNYADRFGIVKNQPSTQTAPTTSSIQTSSFHGSSSVQDTPPECRSCHSKNLLIQFGRYGYYFKCRDCDGNTPIKLGCGHSGHKERVRKSGLKFYRECTECGTSQLFFTNPE